MRDRGHQLALRLRELIARPGGVFAFGVSRPVDALIAQLVGFDALYLTGYGIAAEHGFTDHGIVTATEMRKQIELIADVSEIPCFADADDGYGGVLNVQRTVYNLFTKTSVAAIHLEDQVTPKRCGHIAGKRVLPPGKFLGKLKAAISVRNQVDYARMVVARTDAYGAVGGGLDEAVRRGAAYARAGADSVWCEFPDAGSASAEEFAEAMHRELRSDFSDYPLTINISPSFTNWLEEGNLLSQEMLARHHYRLSFSTYPALLAAAYGVLKTARAFKEDFIGGMKELQREVKGTPVESMMRLLGVEKVLAFEKEFDPEAEENQERSQGFRT